MEPALFVLFDPSDRYTPESDDLTEASKLACRFVETKHPGKKYVEHGVLKSYRKRYVNHHYSTYITKSEYDELVDQGAERMLIDEPFFDS